MPSADHKTSKIKLILRFRGWATIRLPTDPDPADEPRGASGYTFAFSDEKDLDSIIRLQPMDEPELVRFGADWDWGVFVYDAFFLYDDGSRSPAPKELQGAAVRLLSDCGRPPRLENRGWMLTPAAWEPIDPFILSIERETQGDFILRRSAPLDPKNPTRPVWQQPLANLLNKGAKGIWTERETVGSATGIWEPLALIRRRIERLEKEMEKDLKPCAHVQYNERIKELRIALTTLGRRRMARFAVERFSFEMEGDDASVPFSKEYLPGLDTKAGWSVDFWMGGFDPDLFAVFCKGALQIPFKK